MLVGSSCKEKSTILENQIVTPNPEPPQSTKMDASINDFIELKKIAKVKKNEANKSGYQVLTEELRLLRPEIGHCQCSNYLLRIGQVN